MTTHARSSPRTSSAAPRSSLASRVLATSPASSPWPAKPDLSSLFAGGGHSPAGHGVSHGGIVIDLSALRRFELDAAERTAWAGAGLTAGMFTVAAGEHGLATGFGDTSSVGIGGVTLAGG